MGLKPSVFPVAGAITQKFGGEVAKGREDVPWREDDIGSQLGHPGQILPLWGVLEALSFLY